MIVCGTQRLILRSWHRDDRPLFRLLNADPDVMAFFPFRRTHEESDAMMERINAMIEATGYGLYAMQDRHSGEALGFCGIAPVSFEGVFAPATMEIGWRLLPRFWGKGYVTEAAKALLAMAFDERRLAEIVSFAVKDNERSIAVMKRIGLRRDPARDFNHPRVCQDTHPHLRPHVTYTLTLDEWRMR